MIYHHDQLVSGNGNDVNLELENRQSAAALVLETEVFFAKQRYKLHIISPDEGVCPEVLQKYFNKVYGF